MRFELHRNHIRFYNFPTLLAAVDCKTPETVLAGLPSATQAASMSSRGAHNHPNVPHVPPCCGDAFVVQRLQEKNETVAGTWEVDCRAFLYRLFLILRAAEDGGMAAWEAPARVATRHPEIQSEPHLLERARDREGDVAIFLAIWESLFSSRIQDLVADILRSIVEIVTYGDQHDPSIFETVSGKLNKDTIYLLVKVHKYHFGYAVCDDMVYAFITRPPVSDYFSDLVLNMKQQCLHLDILVNAIIENYTDTLRMDLLVEADKFIDDLYYCKDILHIGEPRLSKLLTHNLLSLLVLPLLLPLLHSFETNASSISAVTSLYIVSRLLQIVDDKELINSVAAVLLLSYTEFSTRNNDLISQTDPSNSSFELLNELKGHLTVVPCSETGKAEKELDDSLISFMGFSQKKFTMDKQGVRAREIQKEDKRKSQGLERFWGSGLPYVIIYLAFCKK
ncbi:hypothetical protein ACLOJK_020820 [Asimina triloba]